MDHNECVPIQRAARLARLGRNRETLNLLADEAGLATQSTTGRFVAHLIEVAQGRVAAGLDTYISALPAASRIVASGLCWWAEEQSLIHAAAKIQRGDDRWASLLMVRAKEKARAGDKDHAWRLLSECVACWRELIAEGADAAARLAEALRLSAVMASELRKEREALATAAEACRLFRLCCDRAPLDHIGSWASALHNLAGLRFSTGDACDAVPTARSSIALRRESAKLAPAYFLPDLVIGLTECSRILANVELFDEAQAHAKEAVGLARTLGSSDGEDNAPLLFRALRARSEIAMLAYDWAEGNEAINEEIALLKAEQRQSTPLAVALADALHNQATFLAMLGRDAEAAASLQASLETRSRSENGPRSSALHMAGVLAARSGDAARAVACLSEAASAFEALGDEADIAETCLALAEVHADSGRVADALTATQRAVDSLALSLPGKCTPNVLRSYARSLVRLGDLHRRARQVDAAVAAYQKAAALRDKFRAVGVPGEIAAVAEYKLIACLRRAGRHAEGEAWRQRFQATDLH